jgi:DNA adenine methylase
VGMGGVFFRRSKRPAAEVINDYSGDVANLFRILQRHYPQFMDTLKWQISSRKEFQRLMRVDPETLTDLERAGRFLYLQRMGYGGKVAGRVFGVQNEAPARFNLTKLEPLLEDVHDRLSSVTIECLDYKDFIERYDHASALFYLDPPYYGCESDYGRELFSRAEFEKMAEKLRHLSGKFLLSLNDTPEVRSIFSDFIIRQVQTRYSMSRESNSDVNEVLISNFEGVFIHEQNSLF